jgi:ABC-type anion transport system, duplicated permease component
MNQLALIALAVLATTLRVFVLIVLSIVSGWLLGYLAFKNARFESFYVSFIEVLESVPVISFFPIALIFFVNRIGGVLGVELAADFLVFTAVVWNIWIGIYQAYKTIPKEMLEVVENYGLGFFGRLSGLFIPFSIPRIVSNLFPSVADGFFYITVSEVFAVGSTSYSVFGIGSLLQNYLSENEWKLVYASMLAMALVIVATVFALREFSALAVAKYALDTDVPIMRRGRVRIRYSVLFSQLVSRNPLHKLSIYQWRSVIRRAQQTSFVQTKAKNRFQKVVRYGVFSALISLVLLIAYGVIEVLVTIPLDQWHSLIVSTPSLLVDLAFDYARVSVIALVSLVIAVTLGYYLAVNKSAEAIGIPLIQVLSAYPAPLYFPFVFALSFEIVRSSLGPLSVEFYVVLLGFVSTFYYVFYSFWMGVKSLPHEYWEIMKNLRLGFFQRMRKIVLPASFPYLISGISSTINSAWGGLMLAEYWPNIVDGKTLTVKHGLMKVVDLSTYTGNVSQAAWGSFIFGIVVVVYSLLFTKRMMDIARKRYVAEEGIYAA